MKSLREDMDSAGVVPSKVFSLSESCIKARVFPQSACSSLKARVVPSRVFSLSESCTKERRHEDIVFFV